jgi:hypothetical protein
LRHLVELGRKRYVTLQVIPYSAGAHPAMDNTFTILEFEDVAPTLVYVEGLMGGLYLEREAEIDRYRRVLEYSQNVALSSKETIEFISEIGAQYASASRSLPVTP